MAFTNRYMVHTAAYIMACTTMAGEKRHDKGLYKSTLRICYDCIYVLTHHVYVLRQMYVLVSTRSFAIRHKCIIQQLRWLSAKYYYNLYIIIIVASERWMKIRTARHICRRPAIRESDATFYVFYAHNRPLVNSW